MDFIIDTHGQSDLAEKNRLLDSDDDDDPDIEDTGKCLFEVTLFYFIFEISFIIT